MRRTAGFTLMEALIALVLLALLFAVLLPALQIAGRSWGAAEQRIEQASAAGQASRVLERLIDEARPLQWTTSSEADGFGFRGESERLTFITALPAYRGGGGLQVVELGIGKADGEAGLILTWWPYHPEVPLEADEERRHPELVLSGANGIAFTYHGSRQPGEDAAWHDQWERPELPGMVRMQVFRGDDKVMDVVGAPGLVSSQAAGVQGPRP
ncbi:prepilin-type N-terminal cleavage/methylation domain-containing protein [Arhodomonas sp. AD133]|uniref:prepilin-type N-terminal cleavage/methylation domain-containing protein n=1 Tax=Arhodomonas sp. AD133 TaxID=3415009 RepID=UPI003EBEFD48